MWWKVLCMWGKDLTKTDEDIITKIVKQVIEIISCTKEVNPILSDEKTNSLEKKTQDQQNKIQMLEKQLIKAYHDSVRRQDERIKHLEIVTKKLEKRNSTSRENHITEDCSKIDASTLEAGKIEHVKDMATSIRPHLLATELPKTSANVENRKLLKKVTLLIK
jgi:hypothetical protein